MIVLKTPSEIAIMRRAGAIVAAALAQLAQAARPGITTRALDALAEEAILKQGGRLAFKGYRGFPATLCASVNEEVVHGIPGDRVLNAGDIIGLDLGASVDGYFADAAVTVPVGTVRPEVRRLLDATAGALRRGIEELAVGRRLSNVSASVQRFVESQGFGVVRDFVGHGIGTQLHEDPPIPNFGRPDEGPRLKAGMVLAIEPMVTMGHWAVQVQPDQWTVVTQDRSWAAHFEHTVALTEQGPEILTALN